jgi:MinD-like ATPase involved in chromosome partitioning or flagellar assembly
LVQGGKTIAVFSPVGGAGVSFVATGLAHSLAEKADCAVVDLVRDFGTVQDYLPVKGRRPKLNVVPSSDALLDERSVEGTLRAFASKNAFTVLDLPHTTQDAIAGIALNLADIVLVVVEYNWASILACRRFMDGGYAAKCNVVVNKVEWLPADVITECHKNLGCSPFASIPVQLNFIDRRVAVNSKIPAIEQLARQVGK